MRLRRPRRSRRVDRHSSCRSKGKGPTGRMSSAQSTLSTGSVKIHATKRRSNLECHCSGFVQPIGLTGGSGTPALGGLTGGRDGGTSPKAACRMRQDPMHPTLQEEVTARDSLKEGSISSCAGLPRLQFPRQSLAHHVSLGTTVCPALACTHSPPRFPCSRKISQV